MNTLTINNEYITNITKKQNTSFDSSSFNEENTCDNFNSSFETDQLSDSDSFSETSTSPIKAHSHPHSSTLSHIQLSTSLALSHLLNNNIKHSSPISHVDSSFYSDPIPSISIYDYLTRIIQYTEIDETTLIIALIYIDKYLTSFPQVNVLSQHIIHKLLFTAIILAIKYNEDDIYNNKYYSEVGGVSLSELNQMEYELFITLNCSLFVDNDMLMKYMSVLNQNVRYK
jgi:hypothetical protein